MSMLPQDQMGDLQKAYNTRHPYAVSSPGNPLEERLAMDNSQKVGQLGMDLGTQMAPLANPVMGTMNTISPIVEYLLSLIGGGNHPQPAYKSSQMQSSTQKQQPQPLRSQMMGGPGQEY